MSRITGAPVGITSSVPRVLNHLALGYNRTNSLNRSSGATESHDGNFSWPAKLGISGINGFQFPIVNIGEGVPALSRGNNDDALDNGERFIDNVSWATGKHNFTFGFDFRNQLFGTYNNVNDSGTYNFSRNETAGIQNLGLSGNSIASFLLGGPDNMNAVQQVHAPRWNWQYYAAFAQDDWKVSNHLTLNLGLRYSVDLPHIESYNDTSNFNPGAPNPAANNHPGAMVFANTCSGCNPRWADTKYHDVAPRIGFAYNPGGGKNVLRGGYGIIYSPLQYTDFGGSQVQGFSSTPVFPSPNGFDPAFNWDNGVPPYVHAPDTDPSIVNKGNPNYIQPRFGQPGIIQSWSFQIQRQVSKDTVATLGYAGQRAQNLRSALMNVNNISVNALNLGAALEPAVCRQHSRHYGPLCELLERLGQQCHGAASDSPVPAVRLYLYRRSAEHRPIDLQLAASLRRTAVCRGLPVTSIVHLVEVHHRCR